MPVCSLPFLGVIARPFPKCQPYDHLWHASSKLLCALCCLLPAGVFRLMVAAAPPAEDSVFGFGDHQSLSWNLVQVPCSEYDCPDSPKKATTIKDSTVGVALFAVNLNLSTPLPTDEPILLPFCSPEFMHYCDSGKYDCRAREVPSATVCMSVPFSSVNTIRCTLKYIHACLYLRLSTVKKSSLGAEGAPWCTRVALQRLAVCLRLCSLTKTTK